MPKLLSKPRHPSARGVMEVFEIVIALLLGGAALAAVARRIGAPYPALVALAGAALALITHVPTLVLDLELALPLFVAPSRSTPPSTPRRVGAAAIRAVLEEASVTPASDADACGEDGDAAVVRAATEAQRRLVALRDDGTVGDAAFQRMGEELDWAELD